MEVKEMCALDVWPSILGDQIVGHWMREALARFMLVTSEQIAHGLNRIEQETSVGPLLDPTAYLDGKLFDNARHYKAILKCALELRKALEKATT